MNIDEEKIYVIYEGACFENNESIENTSEKYFLFVGRHEYYKNIHSLIDLYNILPENIKSEYRLIIIGKFHKQYTKFLKKRVREYSLEKNITFISNLLPIELLKYYKNCKILIHLSLYEGFGLTILEAMSLGKPVIAYDVSSIPEILKEKELLFKVNDLESIKNKIIEILNSDEKYNYLSNKVVEISREFSWEKTTKILYSVFTS